MIFNKFNPYSSEVRDMLDAIMAKRTDFKYLISEGGWMSEDRTVIFVTNRFPYNGRLMPMREDIDKDKFNYWFNIIESLVEVNLE